MMSRRSVDSLKFDAKQAALVLPELERTTAELLLILDRYEALDKSFRQKFLKIFKGPKIAVNSDDKKWALLQNTLVFTQANLAGQALSHLRYAADLAEMTCGVLSECCRSEATNPR